MPADSATIREIRVEALRYLYARPSAAMQPPAIARAVRKAGVECADEDVMQQLSALTGLLLVQVIEDPDMPAIKGFKITPSGITHFEKHHA